jgi:hypothetical protein
MVKKDLKLCAVLLKGPPGQIKIEWSGVNFALRLSGVKIYLAECNAQLLGKTALAVLAEL